MKNIADVALAMALATALVSTAAVASSPTPCGAAPAVAGIITPYPKRTVYVGDSVTIIVCHAGAFLAEAEAREQKVTLFVDGIDTGNEPIGIDHDSGKVMFALARNEDNKELWKWRIYDPLFEPIRPISIGIGKGGGPPLARLPGANVQVSLDKIWVDASTYIWIALMIAVVIAIILYAMRTDLLREGPAIGGMRQPFSLARTQMAWWFLLTVVGYMFIWMITGDNDSLPPSLLGLVGISAATAVAAVAITTGSKAGALRKMLEDEITAIDFSLARIDNDLTSNELRIAEATTAARGVATLQEVKAALNRARDEQEALRARVLVQLSGITSMIATKSLWHDLVMDERGAVALDRLQIMVWTIVLGGVFLWTVLWTLTMPEFNATLLALMGISSGTYIGFKLPQRS